MSLIWQGRKNPGTKEMEKLEVRKFEGGSEGGI